MNRSILCVDDDANILAGFQRNLRKDFEVKTALGPQEGLAALKNGKTYAVIVADMQMPGMNGVEFLIEAQKLVPDTVRMMLTGNADQKTAMDAVNQGHVFRFLTKPCPAEILAQSLEMAIRQYQLVIAEKEILEKTLRGSINMLTDIIALNDPATFGRSQALRDSMKEFVQSMGVRETWEYEVAAMLAEIGTVTLPRETVERWRKGAVLSTDELELIRRIPETGAGLINNIPRLEGVSRIVLYQAKNFDGTGFPDDNVSGSSLPIASRILRVLLEVENRKLAGEGVQKALMAMEGDEGRFDPLVIAAAYKHFDLYQEAQESEPVVEPLSVSMRELISGNILADKVETTDGVVLAPAGTVITSVLLEKLRSFSKLMGVKEPILIEP